MRFLIPLLAAALAACGPAEAPAPDRSEMPAAGEPAAARLSPPGASEFRAAWAEQCDASEEEVGSALCKATAPGVDTFTCDFALGDDDYRRYSADLARSGDRWVLADPQAACALAEES